MRSCVAVMVLVLLAGCQESGPEVCRMARATELSLRPEGGHAVMTALLNGTPTNLILDTGSADTVLTRDAASRLALSLTPLQGYYEGVGGSRGAYMFVARNFQIGGLHGHNLALRASEMQLSSAKHPVDGLLGDNFLAAYDLDLDLPERKAILFSKIEGCGTPAARLDGQLYALPMSDSSNANNHMPRVRVVIGGTTLLAVVDSGASHSLIFRNAARRLGLRLADLKTDRHFQESGIGPDHPDAVRHVLTPVTVGELTISNMPAAIVDQRGLDDVDMLLGLDFLSRVHVWFSFSSRTLIMQFPPRPSPNS